MYIFLLIGRVMNVENMEIERFSQIPFGVPSNIITRPRNSDSTWIQPIQFRVETTLLLPEHDSLKGKALISTALHLHHRNGNGIFEVSRRPLWTFLHICTADVPCIIWSGFRGEKRHYKTCTYVPTL